MYILSDKRRKSMIIEDMLAEIDEPERKLRAGKECYYDRYRKNLIEVTPEETVRQKVALLLESRYGVPKSMIKTEEAMSHYDEKKRGRADIIIDMPDKNGQTKTLAIVECKKPDVDITFVVFNQAKRYRDIAGGKYIFITNGLELEVFVYMEDTEEYVRLEEIPSYEEMLGDMYRPADFKIPEFTRFTMEELKDQDIIDEYNRAGSWIYGESTEAEMRMFCVNLYQCFLDSQHKLSPTVRESFEMVEDLGRKWMDHTNAGGGHYEGTYRAFMVRDRHGDMQIVSLSLFGTDPNFRNENRRSYTYLVVAVDAFNKSHNSLQYNMDDFCKKDKTGRMVFRHNGSKSNAKNATVLEKVNELGKGLKVFEKSIYIGSMKSDKILYLDDSEVAEVIYNLIEYALIREEIKK